MQESSHDPTLEVNQNIWEKIYSHKQDILKYPCEDLVVSFYRSLSSKDLKGKKCLDIGFGSGNNLEFLTSTGLDCYGVEISESAVEITQERLRSLHRQAKLSLSQGNKLPYEDGFFDIVVAWHVLSYNDEETFDFALSEIKRVLKPNAPLLAAISTYQQVMITKGIKLRKNIFRYCDKNSNQDGVILIAAENEQEARKLFSSFDSLDIGHSEISFKGITNAHWIIYAENPQNV